MGLVSFMLMAFLFDLETGGDLNAGLQVKTMIPIPLTSITSSNRANTRIRYVKDEKWMVVDPPLSSLYFHCVHCDHHSERLFLSRSSLFVWRNHFLSMIDSIKRINIMNNICPP